ncbi:hypothetical protein CDD81_5779 [Ophiocordyceps australis]|uniref:Uncharacterized protein n=1 Tax=Ophiocordyceps australis TaxID=1399860 RepID=A0A2C5XI55_9HYPO|nr:hypothetical protein CDD81_5779 [Ophiocordyceps australis]
MSDHEAIPIFAGGTPTSPSFFFHHHINPQTASLHITLLGPDLCFTFSHPHAHSLHLSPRDTYARLDKKTTGFIALSSSPPTPHTHSILAWAESGHAAGSTGLCFNPSPPALCNLVWSTRALALARALGINMARPFDAMGSRCPVLQARRAGLFLASHVEVKLATYAIHVLLRLCGLYGSARGGDSLRHALWQLRRVEWPESRTPGFDIFLSRKNCPPCLEFMQRVYAATRIRIRIRWRHRVQTVSYDQIAMRGNQSLDAATDDDQDSDIDAEGQEQEQEQEQGDTSPLVITPPELSTNPSAKGPRPRRADPLPVEKPLPATPETQAPSRSCVKPARRSVLRQRGG